MPDIAYIISGVAGQEPNAPIYKVLEFIEDAQDDCDSDDEIIDRVIELLHN
jgi:hypothetical protein